MNAQPKQYISLSSEWTEDLLVRYDQEISRIAQDFKLDTYPNQIEIINAEQMMDAYASVGMPLGYSHWSFGKQFLTIEKNYRRGHMGLAYEMVINADPCITYLMEENTLPMQALVIAHASYGHNSFFKGNYLFRTWTSPDSIIDYLVFAKNYISECEERYGVDAVENIIDACHTLRNFGVDRYKHPNKLSLQEEKARQDKRAEYLQSQVNEIWRTLPPIKEANKESTKNQFLPEPQENILYFIEKHAPLLEPWQREIVRIVRKSAQYFYPQRQTKVMNEGWATFWHYHILHKLYDEGFVNDQFMIEFLHNHTNVVTQPAFDHKVFSGINPYLLGFSIFQDIKRISDKPTDEDKHWFPDLIGKNWLENVDFAMRHFKDESFIAQFLSPKVIRDMKLFCLNDDDSKDHLEITAIHNEDGYQQVRQALSEFHNYGNQVPDIQVVDVDIRGDRALTLRYTQHHKRPLDKSYSEVLKHVQILWGFPVKLEVCSHEGKRELLAECPSKETPPEKPPEVGPQKPPTPTF